MAAPTTPQWITTPRQRKMHQNTVKNLKTGASMTLFVLMAMYFLFPLVWLMVSATKDTHQLFKLGVFSTPTHLRLFYNLHWLFTYGGDIYLRWFANSVGYSGTVAILATLISAMLGYALAKYDFWGKRIVFSVVLAGLMVPVAVLTIPIFLLEDHIGMINSYLGVILPMLVSPFGVYFMYVYTRSAVPTELLEAGRVDGARDFFIFFRIVVPVILPGLVTLILINFVGSWNNFFLPLVLLNNPKLFPVTLGLESWAANLNAVGAIPLYPLVITGAFLSVLPMLVLFPILRRYINIGLTSGGIKG